MRPAWRGVKPRSKAAKRLKPSAWMVDADRLAWTLRQLPGVQTTASLADAARQITAGLEPAQTPGLPHIKMLRGGPRGAEFR